MTEPVSWIVAGTLLLAAIALAAVVYARRSGLLAAAIERQIMELRSQMAAEQQGRREQERDAAAQLDGVIRSAETIANQRSKETADGFRSITAELQRGLGDISGHLASV